MRIKPRRRGKERERERERERVGRMKRRECSVGGGGESESDAIAAESNGLSLAYAGELSREGVRGIRERESPQRAREKKRRGCEGREAEERKSENV